jgi:DNA-binding response OmpR family regulator
VETNSTRRRVLVIDPFVDEGDMFAEYLRQNGFEVDVCTDATDGLRTAARQPPDAVITRIRQSDPTLDGIDITRRLKRSAMTADVPILVITTSLLPGDRQAAADAQCDCYLELPVSPDTLAAELQRVLDRQEGERPEAGQRNV